MIISAFFRTEDVTFAAYLSPSSVTSVTKFHVVNVSNFNHLPTFPFSEVFFERPVKVLSMPCSLLKRYLE